MRTTVNIADDVLQAAKELARRQKKTAGQVLSELARQALMASQGSTERDQGDALLGFEPFPKRGGIVTHELIDNLRDEDVT